MKGKFWRYIFASYTTWCLIGGDMWKIDKGDKK